MKMNDGRIPIADGGQGTTFLIVLLRIYKYIFVDFNDGCEVENMFLKKERNGGVSFHQIVYFRIIYENKFFR